MATSSDVLKIAASQIGYSRWSDPQKGTKYGRWYADLTGIAYYGYNGVPYCAMFASWVFNQAGATCAGLPGAYTPTMLNAAKRAGKVISNKKDAQPGDIVYFNWDGGVVDHVGIAEKNLGPALQTIEGNTGNGQVMRRTRAWSTIEAVVRPDWSSVKPTPTPQPTPTPAPTPKPTPTPKPKPTINLTVDGLWGKDTTRGLQTYLGTSVDGIVSQQYAAYRASNPGLLSSSWEWVKKPKSGGSEVIRALQRKLGVNPDGYVGPNTIKALQRKLGTGVDGKVSKPSAMVKALQRALNNGTF